MASPSSGPTTISEAPTAQESAPGSTPPSPTPGAAISGGDEAAAVAFVEYWFANLTYAYNTGDTKPLKDLAGPSCDTCADVITRIEDVYASGGSMRGGAVSLQEVNAPPGIDYAEGVVVTARLQQATIEVRDASGRIRDRFPTVGEERFELGVQRSEDGWLLIESATRA